MEGWKAFGEKKPRWDQVRDPEDPAKYLLANIDFVPNREYPDNPDKQELVKKRRELIRSCAEQIEVIGAELARAFIDTYAKHGLQITGGVRFYIVGGRLEGKPLNEGSDLDCAFTVVNPAEDVQPRPGDEPKEVYERKVTARREFARTVFDDIVRKYGFMLEETLTDGEKVVGTLLEPKEYGRPDDEFRKYNMPALLVVTVK
jgi:hypothetical protein